jgi:hypothetical protein
MDLTQRTNPIQTFITSNFRVSNPSAFFNEPSVQILHTIMLENGASAQCDDGSVSFIFHESWQQHYQLPHNVIESFIWTVKKYIQQGDVMTAIAVTPISLQQSIHTHHVVRCGAYNGSYHQEANTQSQNWMALADTLVSLAHEPIYIAA